MTDRQRFLNTLNFDKVDDRIPMVEWAAWWNLTTDRWTEEGMPPVTSLDDSLRYFGLDVFHCIGAMGATDDTPAPASHGGAVITDEASYERIRPTLFSDKTIEKLIESAQALKERHDNGDVIIRLWLDGFFWFPRTLFGIEEHLLAFYDQPELMHRINSELADFDIRAIEALFPILKPDMVGFAEDMSYNNGPMLSHELFKEFLQPYYQRVIPHIKKYDTKVLIDSDGDIYTMISWMRDAGIEGIYPLERQAGVDLVQIRRENPDFLMLGGFDKMVMPLGETAMRAEFERLLPVMRSGGYIPSVDHQTPPGVSLDNYRIYIKLFKEYAAKAAN